MSDFYRRGMAAASIPMLSDFARDFLVSMLALVTVILVVFAIYEDRI